MRHSTMVCVGLLLAGCTSEQDVPCDAPSFVLEVPASRASDVADVTVSGAFCSPSGIECVAEADDGCLTWWVTPNEGVEGEGECTVEVSFECAVPEQRIDIAWVRYEDGECDGALYTEPDSRVLDGPSCDDSAALGGAGGAGAAGAAGAVAAAGEAGADRAGGGG